MHPRNEIVALFMDHRRRLVNYASTITGDRGHAEDIVQEAYLRFDAAAAERLLEQPVQFLYRIVRNLAIDDRRRDRRERRRFAGDDRTIVQVPESAPSPEREALARRDLALVRRALDELPERTRMALELHRFGGCTFKEIAARLGISVGLAHALVVDGIEHCRQRLHRRS